MALSSQKRIQTGKGCGKADNYLGYKLLSCDDCPFSDCPWGWSSPEVRNAIKIYLLWHKGKTIQEIVAETRASERTIKRYIRMLQLFTHGPRWRAWRDRMIVNRHAEGESVAELARIFRLSRREIYRVLRKPSIYQQYQDAQIDLSSKFELDRIEAILEKHPETIGFLLLGMAQERVRWLLEDTGLPLEDKDIQLLIDSFSPHQRSKNPHSN